MLKFNSKLPADFVLLPLKLHQQQQTNKKTNKQTNVDAIKLSCFPFRLFIDLKGIFRPFRFVFAAAPSQELFVSISQHHQQQQHFSDNNDSSSCGTKSISTSAARAAR